MLFPWILLADSHRQRIINWIDGTGQLSTAFDFTTKGILQVLSNFNWTEISTPTSPLNTPTHAHTQSFTGVDICIVSSFDYSAIRSIVVPRLIIPTFQKFLWLTCLFLFRKRKQATITSKYLLIYAYEPQYARS